MNFVEEMKWRGFVYDATPGAEEVLKNEKVAVYLGIDPTGDSLHIGHFMGLIAMMHFQRNGHTPIFLIGGATGMIGDPSGKSEERNLLSIEIIDNNIKEVSIQLRNLFNFNDVRNKAIMVNNYDWLKDLSYIEFIRDIGKHITVNSMLSKESVKKRLEKGLSFTEFTYQLAQAYDFLYLNKHYSCKLQVGGSDQWGNIVTGTELVRKKNQTEVFGLTWPLLTKSDGGKFGKTEGGNIWLNPEKTSPYKFLQYWLNVSDEDAKKLIKLFTFRERQEIEELVNAHEQAPHQRILQNILAKDITILVHSEKEYNAAVEASEILFGKDTSKTFNSLSERNFLDLFEGVPMKEILKSDLGDSIGIIDILSTCTGFLKSKGEARRELKQNSISLNQSKVKEDYQVTQSDFINEKYLVLQKGKKSYFLVIVK